MRVTVVIKPSFKLTLCKMNDEEADARSVGRKEQQDRIKRKTKSDNNGTGRQM